MKSMYIRIYIYVCTYIRMYVGRYVCTYICMYPPRICTVQCSTYVLCVCVHGYQTSFTVLIVY